jgi:hypothetical protein
MKTLKLYEIAGYSDYLEATPGNQSIQIECYEPWAGDTETGFGRGGSIQLSKEQAIELASWLLTAAKNMQKAK